MIRTIRPLGRPDPGLERVAKANEFSEVDSADWTAP